MKMLCMKEAFSRQSSIKTKMMESLKSKSALLNLSQITIASCKQRPKTCRLKRKRSLREATASILVQKTMTKMKEEQFQIGWWNNLILMLKILRNWRIRSQKPFRPKIVWLKKKTQIRVSRVVRFPLKTHNQNPIWYRWSHLNLPLKPLKRVNKK